MASAVPIGKALEEATCSICLEYLTEPVTIECGHNFCRACITQYSERRKSQSGTKFPCPECRALFQKGNFRPNRQLANIIESIKPLRLQPGQAQNENLCETHKEKLQLFYKEDGKATFAVPIEEVAQGYKVKLQEILGPLRQKLEEALALVSAEEKKIREWQVGVWVHSSRSPARCSVPVKLQAEVITCSGCLPSDGARSRKRLVGIPAQQPWG
uniref:RING-type domain-containing protein n=1 Tax=Gopherus agassizii TaxID=38772 RepID=A0A452IBI3_9SAUR